MSSQPKHGLLEYNVKTGKYLPGDRQGQISYTFLDHMGLIHLSFFQKW